jgi:hypothetical protein
MKPPMKPNRGFMKVSCILNMLNYIDEKRGDESFMRVEIVSWRQNFPVLFSKYNYFKN